MTAKEEAERGGEVEEQSCGTDKNGAVADHGDADMEGEKTGKADRAPGDAEEVDDVDGDDEGKEEEEGDYDDKDENCSEEGEAEAEDEAEDSKPAKTEVKELEVDAEPDTREKFAQPVTLSDLDASPNVFFSGEGAWGSTIVSSFSQGGFGHLFSGVRSNVGAKASRYFFEVKVLDRATDEHPRQRNPRNASVGLRVGVSTSKSSLFLGDGSCDSACFDCDCSYFAPSPDAPRRPKRTRINYKWQGKMLNKVVGVVLNLDRNSPNANTLSLFLDGVRISEPQPLPEHLHGKALYPTVTFKNVTLAVNLGCAGIRMAKLPFTCRMFNEVAAADAESETFQKPLDGKYSVVVPVGLPQEGFFDYVDHFLEKNPHFTELSDRKLIDWCVKSDLRTQTHRRGVSTRDRPAFRFGIPGIDKQGLSSMMRTITGLSKRHYIVAEANANLLSKEREDLIGRFSASHFKITAHIAVGEPTTEHKDWVHQRILAEHAAKVKKLEMEEDEADEDKDGIKDEVKDEDKIAEENNDGKKDGVKEEEEQDLKEPAVKKRKVDEASTSKLQEPTVGPNVWYLPHSTTESEDVATSVLAQSYKEYTLPTMEEGFTEVDYVWRPKTEAQDHLSKWVAVKKRTMVIDGLKPSKWFKEKLDAWKESQSEMRKKQSDSKRGKTQDNDEKKEGTSEPDKLHELGSDGSLVYSGFQREDWTLLACRYELHLLTHAFVLDADDEYFPGVPTEHLSHYFKVYFKGSFSPLNLGCEDINEVVTLIKDVLKIVEKDNQSFLVSLHEKETELLTFVKLVEAEREDRVRRIEAGEESARLKIPKGKGHGKDRSAKGKAKGKRGESSKTQEERGAEDGGTSRLWGGRRPVRSKGKGKHRETLDDPRRPGPWARSQEKGARSKGSVARPLSTTSFARRTMQSRLGQRTTLSSPVGRQSEKGGAKDRTSRGKPTRPAGLGSSRVKTGLLRDSTSARSSITQRTGPRDSAKGMRDSGKGQRDSGKGQRDSGKGQRDSGKGLRDSGKGRPPVESSLGKRSRDAGSSRSLQPPASSSRGASQRHSASTPPASSSRGASGHTVGRGGKGPGGHNRETHSSHRQGSWGGNDSAGSDRGRDSSFGNTSGGGGYSRSHHGDSGHHRSAPYKKGASGGSSDRHSSRRDGDGGRQSSAGAGSGRDRDRGAGYGHGRSNHSGGGREREGRPWRS